MAGINRLGKGPAKPGTMRPADPNKYKTTDIFSEGTEGDKEYQRMVQDIEDSQQNHTGFLFGRGAFDKGDLLYLRDEEEKKRFAEQEQRESEERAFNRMRQKKMALEENSLPEMRPPPNKNTDQMSHSDTLKGRIRIKPQPKVKLKNEPGIKHEERPEKKIKLEPGVLPKTEKKEELEPDVKLGPVGSHIPQIKDDDRNGGKSDEIENEEEGLGGLLGNYDSDSDEEDASHQEKKPELPLPEMFQTNIRPKPP